MYIWISDLPIYFSGVVQDGTRRSTMAVVSGSKVWSTDNPVKSIKSIYNAQVQQGRRGNSPIGTIYLYVSAMICVDDSSAFLLLSFTSCNFTLYRNMSDPLTLVLPSALYFSFF